MKTVLITGASSGIGAALAEQFAKKSYRLILLARNQQKLNVLAEKLKQVYSIQCTYAYLDLTDLEEVKKIPERYPVDYLVNCAGVGEIGDFQSIPLQQELDEIMIDFLAPMILSKLYAQQFVQNGSGLIINICSTASLYVHPYLTSYSASKAALLFYSLGLQEEIAQVNKKIRVLTVCPGPTKTNFFKDKVNHTYQNNPLANAFQMTSDSVATLIVKELFYTRSFRIIGLRNRWTTFFIRCLPKRIQIQVAGNYIRKGVQEDA